MTHIFISYSSKNRDLITELAEDLDLLVDNCLVWYDRELNRSGGHQWWSLILQEIRRCDVFIYALSPQVLTSEPCRREYAYARALGKPVLPVIVTDVEIRHLPRELQEAQLVNYRQRSREQQRSLKESIRNLPAAPPLPDPLPTSPEAPLDPVGMLFDRITRLTADPDAQKYLIVDIEDLNEEDAFQKHVPELLQRLLDRDDVLTQRNSRRAQELLAKTQSTILPSTPPAVGTGFFPSAAASFSPVGDDLRVVPVPAPGTRRSDDKGVPQVYVPPGTLLMGSTPQQVDEAFAQAKKDYKNAEREWYERELPQHEVVIAAGFWLDLHPVTNEAYARFIRDGGYKERSLWTPGGWEWVQTQKTPGPEDYEKFIDPQQPRVGVTWFEAYAYCQWRGGRLPTEAEWEWAARGPENRIYPWGNTFDANRVIYAKNSGGKTSPVGSGVRTSGASWVGALDMSGNVWEWCSTLYQPYPYRADDGREGLEDSTNFRVLRGGSWRYLNATFLRAPRRSRIIPNLEDSFSGFRCARSYSSES